MLRATRAAWRALMENPSNVVFVLDSMGKIDFVNRAAPGIDSQNFIGKRACDIFDSRHRALVRETIEKVLRTGTRAGCWAGAAQAFGRESFYEIKAEPVLLGDEPVGAMVVCTDVSESRRTRTALSSARRELRRSKLEVRKKSLALEEVISHIEAAKIKTKEDIIANANEVLLPLFMRLRQQGVVGKYADMFESCLREIGAPFGRALARKGANLSPREIEIAGMIRGGLASKEIAAFLSLSLQTVDKHRKNIRKKLGISRRGGNLVSLLRSVAS